MKQLLIFLLVLISFIPVSAQNYGALNSLSRRAMVIWHKGSNGYYYRDSEQMINGVTGIEKQYAFDKKERILYVLTSIANVAITLDKDNAKAIKKDKSIPQIKGDELNKLIAAYSKQLDDKFTRLNEQRRVFIQDSIAKVRADSIERVHKHEQYLARLKKEADEYKSSHDWRRVPTNNVSLVCTLCDESFSDDTTNCIGIKNDSIYFYTIKREDLGLDLLSTHQAKIPEDLASNKDFQYHYKVFKDSLTNDTVDYNDVVNYLGWEYNNRYISKVKRIAPFGYVDDWGWDDEYSMITFNIDYVNTNPKTIRYLTIYFVVTNDVGDVRCRGYFRGTGPVKQGEKCSWSWDSSPYFVAGDASNMNITKIVLTWMNGKTQVVSGRYLRFNSSDDDDSDDSDE